jgi:hypothetical protein
MRTVSRFEPGIGLEIQNRGSGIQPLAGDVSASSHDPQFAADPTQKQRFADRSSCNRGRCSWPSSPVPRGGTKARTSVTHLPRFTPGHLRRRHPSPRRCSHATGAPRRSKAVLRAIFAICRFTPGFASKGDSAPQLRFDLASRAAL